MYPRHERWPKLAFQNSRSRDTALNIFDHIRRHHFRATTTVVILIVIGAACYAIDLVGLAIGLVSGACGALGLKLGIGRP